MKVLEKVIKLLSEQLGVDEGEITADSNISEDLNADSLDIVEMLMGLEEEFGVTIPDEEATGLKTVGDVVSYLESH